MEFSWRIIVILFFSRASARCLKLLLVEYGSVNYAEDVYMLSAFTILGRLLINADHISLTKFHSIEPNIAMTILMAAS